METYILKTKYLGSVIEQSYYKHKENILKSGHSSQEEKQRSSRSRAISRIKEIVYCNDFSYFFTLTIKDSFRYDIEHSINYLTSIMNYYKKLHSNFKFVYVYELTKNNRRSFTWIRKWFGRYLFK